MLEPDQLEAMVQAILRIDPDISIEDASRIAASIGDTPLILDGKVIGMLHGQEVPLPVHELFPDDE